MFSEVPFSVLTSRLRWGLEQDRRSLVAGGVESQGDPPLSSHPRRRVPLLATETPRRRFSLFGEHLVRAGPRAELLLPDSRESAARASVKSGRGAAPTPRAWPTPGTQGCPRDGTGARTPPLRQLPRGPSEGGGGGRGQGSAGGKSPGVTRAGRCQTEGAERRGSAVPAPQARSHHGRRGGGGAAPSRAGPPPAEPVRRRGRSGPRMKELRFAPRLGGRDGLMLGTRRQRGSPKVLGGGKLSNGGGGKRGGGRREAGGPAPPP